VIISKPQLYQLIREEVLKEFGGDPPMTPDEYREHEISHAADRESRELAKQFRDSLKRGTGRVWGDDAVERREEEVAAAAIESVLPRLYAALEMAPGEDRDDEVKYVVYVLSNLDPEFYKPSKEELEGFTRDPAEAGDPTPRKLTGTIPSLGIDLANA
tara:strand:+ start:284 stop:757 length:474 start_codon:yes stop_codon:yes gene_type:complete